MARSWVYSYDMYDLGEYPCIIPGNGRVYGEVYRVGSEVLRTLDYIEDYDEKY